MQPVGSYASSWTFECLLIISEVSLHSANQLVWFYYQSSIRGRTKLVDLPLVVADRRHAILGHIIRLPEETPAHTVLQHVNSVTNGWVSTRSTTENMATWYNNSSRIMTVTLIWSGGKPMIVLRGDCYDPDWSGTVSEWLSTCAHKAHVCL